MEYVQLTLDDWLEMKQKLKMELQGVKQSFVRIGYALRQMDDQKLYERDGYKSIAEFAKAEYGLESSTVSRFMSINREYSVDGYSEHLKLEYMDMGRSQLEEMLKLPEEDRTMIRPETPRDDIRELKKFNKTTPEQGVADDIHELIKKFFETYNDILKELYSSEAFLTRDVEKTSQLVDIVNPSGTRTFKKGIYFLMMYEQNIKIKKFMGTPETMEWPRFFEITKEIFGQQLAEPEPPEPAEEHEEHPEEMEIEMPEPVQEAPQEQQEPAPVQAEAIEPEEEQDENDSQMGTAGTEPDEPRRAEKHSEKEKPVEQIAPAQKSTETLEKEKVEDDETGENESSDAENQTAESEPETAEREQTEETEAIETVCGTRKEYMDRLSEQGMAEYMADEYKSHRLRVTDLADTWNLCKWLSEKVDRFGRPVEEE